MTTFDPFSPEFLVDPYPTFRELVDNQPVFWSADLGYWVVSRHTDCRRVLREYDTFSAANALDPLFSPCPAARVALVEGKFRSIPTLPNVDPPAHTRTRRIAHLAFTPRRVAAMEPFIRDLVRRFVSERLHHGRAEIVSALTWELPALVVFQILGVPSEDVETVKQGSEKRLLWMFGHPTADEQVEIASGMATFWRYCEALAEDRRANPREDFTTDLVHTPDASGEPLTQQEVSTILFGLLLAGHETTTNILGNSLRRLLENRETWEAISADASLIPGAVDEVLRYDSSVIHWRRRTAVDALVGDVTIPADSNVLVCIGAANRDPGVFAHPHDFDIRRANANEHLSFGSGPHLCLGAPLARLEARVVLEELSSALPSLRLRPDQHLEFMPIIGFRGPKALEVEWDEAQE